MNVSAAGSSAAALSMRSANGVGQFGQAAAAKSAPATAAVQAGVDADGDNDGSKAGRIDVLA